MRRRALVSGFGTQTPSQNDKLRSRRGGPAVYATYRPVGPTCPTCPLLDNGCYAQGGNVALHANASRSWQWNPRAWAESLPAGSLVRWNVSGDVVGEDGPDYRAGITAAHRRRPDLRGWLYTHAWAESAVSDWAWSLPAGVRCVASVDRPSDVPAARAAGFRTVACVVVPADGKDSFTQETAAAATAAVRQATGETRVVACPAQRRDRPAVGCADCTACSRDGLVLFAVHGNGQRKARRALEVIS